MVYLTQTPLVSILRMYDQPGGYEQRMAYVGALSISHLTETTVYMSAALGRIDRESWDEAIRMLKAQGVTTLLYERRGKIKTRTI